MSLLYNYTQAAWDPKGAGSKGSSKICLAQNSAGECQEQSG